MSEYCEYMWDPARGHTSSTLARSIYEQETRFDKRDKKLAIKTVRILLRDMPDVDLKHCTDEYITRFLLARKYRVDQAAALIAAYQAQVALRQDIFGNLTARDPALQRALRAGIPGVLPARDRKGRCVLVILASQWDPIAVPALSVQRAIFLVLETLIQDPRNQKSGFVAVVDWSGFSLRQGGALGAAALRNLIAALRGRFPARFKAIHFLSAPLYVQATLTILKPFLDEKTRNKIYLHGNNLSTLHEHLPTDILPAELGGTGPAFNPGLWAEPVIHSAMKEAELAALKKEQERNDFEYHRDDNKIITIGKMENGNKLENDSIVREKKSVKAFGVRNNRNSCPIRNGEEFGLKMKLMGDQNINKTENHDKLIDIDSKHYSDEEECDVKEQKCTDECDNNKDLDDLTLLEFNSETNSSEFEMISGKPESEEGSLDGRSEKILMRTGKSNNVSEEINLIT